ncbi:MAG: 1-(5-phosphoribosyl)-5-[(5-phosphoribosylamino)methylideneamino]imidazole-4-carboxamide isomerase [Bacteroidota bacterium]
MYIIPAIDIIDGKCVRLTQGDYAQKKVYNEDPLEVAKAFADVGVTRLHLVDLDGARAQHIVNYKVLERIAKRTDLHIDFGGGLKADEDLHIAFESGAAQVTGGTVAVKNPDLFLSWLARYGAERIILGADVKNGKVAVSGWQEESAEELFPFLERYLAAGIQYAICTEVSRDGLLQGSDTDLYQRIRKQFPNLQLIASGGITTQQEVEDLTALGCFGAIIGKAIYEGRVDLAALLSE